MPGSWRSSVSAVAGVVALPDQGGQELSGIVRGRVRLAELELIAVGDALARVMLTAPLLP
jgi:hypothetical protein